MGAVTEGLKNRLIGLMHIGHVVESIEESIATFRRVYSLGDDDIRLLPEFEGAPTRFAFVRVGPVEFELIEPLSDEFRAILLGVKSGEGGINHVAYRVDDIDKALADLQAINIRPGYVTPGGVIDTGRTRIAYLNPDDTGALLIELVEVKPGTKGWFES